MSERLYYTDAWLRSFDARITSATQVEGAFHVILDRTAFYPDSGGQPSDTGALFGTPIVSLRENEDGDVVHVVGRRPEGESVHGDIDWPRRFDHMQQHTGQHLLSAVLIELFNYPTVSFHLGADISTIDLGASSLSEDQVLQAEQRSNEIVFEDRPVRISFASQEEAVRLGLRKEVKREGTIRLIEIEHLDLTACGGTHVSSTGQIGSILLRKFEKSRQGMRLELACGGRAVAWARKDYGSLTSAAAAFTAHPHELPALVRKKIEESKAAEKEQRRLIETLAGYEAREMWAQATPDAAGLRTVEKEFAADPTRVRYLAQQIAAQPNARAILTVLDPPTLVAAQSKGRAADLGAIVKSLGLRGGGSHDAAQAGAPDAESLRKAIATLKQSL